MALYIWITLCSAILLLLCLFLPVVPQRIKINHFIWTISVGAIGALLLAKSYDAAMIFFELDSGAYDWFKASAEIVRIMDSAEFQRQKKYLVLYFFVKYLVKTIFCFLLLTLFSLKLEIGAKFTILLAILMTAFASYFGLNLTVFIKYEIYISLALVGVFISPKVLRKLLVCHILTQNLFGEKENKEDEFLSILMRSLLVVCIVLILDISLWRIVDGFVYPILGIF